MFPETSLTVKVSPGYVVKWLVVTALLASAIPLGLVAFMWHSGFNAALATGVAITVIFVLWVLLRTYRNGVKQAIHLHQNKIIFDYITYTQEFSFVSPGEWHISEENGNWKIKSLSDRSFKLVPKSAFPQLKAIAGRFYAAET